MRNAAARGIPSPAGHAVTQAGARRRSIPGYPRQTCVSGPQRLAAQVATQFYVEVV